ncbi:hypothetical protein T484DRAFT_1747442 [Baffinella frigidus]|nr:hypothetical protein T484DRAFT_1747442 [Cryptophyta sp. CCMP2293]
MLVIMASHRSATLLALLLAITSGTPLLGATQHQARASAGMKSRGHKVADVQNIANVGRRADGSFHLSLVLAAALKESARMCGVGLRLRGGKRVGGLREYIFLDQQKAGGGRQHEWGGFWHVLGYHCRRCKVCGVLQGYSRSYGSNRNSGYAPLPKEYQDCPGKPIYTHELMASSGSS